MEENQSPDGGAPVAGIEQGGSDESGAALTGVERDRQTLAAAREKGGMATLGAYVKLSGPGWLQSAITLGGGSLSSSLYLGVLAGFALLWLQPLAMIIGIIMLSAIGYVTLSTGQRPFKAIKEHVNPVLGWGWILATLLANCVWSLPQFNLAWGSVSQNLMPDVFSGMQADTLYQAKWAVSGGIALLCIIVVFCYDGGGMAVKFFNILLKAMVGIIVLSFLGVVVYMTAKGTLDWDRIGNGIIPDFRMLWTPASTFGDSLGAVGETFRGFWEAEIVHEQQDVLIAAAATAVGINMTFLLPYSMLKRGWNKDFRGLAVFDLSTGLFIPFILATGCVVIASASQFHTQPAVPFAAEEASIAITAEAASDEFANASAEDKAKRIEGFVTKAYANWLTDEGKESFATDAATKALAAITGVDFAQRSNQDKQAHIKGILDGAAEGKVRKADGKLVGGYTKWALMRVQKAMDPDDPKNAAAKLKAEIEKRALDLAPAELKADYAKITKTVDKEQFTVELTKIVMDLGYAKKAKDQLVAELPLADRKIAAMLVRRDSIHLARALSPLTGDVVANYVFGIGVIGMAVSSIIILMLINGFTICEMVDRPSHGWLYRFGCMIPAVGMAGPFIWSGAAPFLAIPTSVIGFIVIPIAYATFALLLNQRKLLGDNMPRSFVRWIWNLLMFVGVIAVMIGSTYMAWKKTKGVIWDGGWVGIGGVGLFVLLVLIAQVRMKKRAAQQA